MDRIDKKNLKKRYLVWFYKTTKEAFDKIERKFTQLEIDAFVLKGLKKEKNRKIENLTDGFEAYIKKKEAEGLSLKFDKENLRPEYEFLSLKLKAIEKAIKQELGDKALKEIKFLYEEEMTERILKSTEH